MNTSKNSISETIETQIAIMGGGGAGLAAAVAAAEKGADVVVLEKRGIFGGNSAMAEGLLAAESPAQKRMNIDAPRDEVFRMAMSFALTGLRCPGIAINEPECVGKTFPDFFARFEAMAATAS